MSQALITSSTAEAPANENHQQTVFVSYIRDMLRELIDMTPADTGYLLPYLMEMARTEASDVVERLKSRAA